MELGSAIGFGQLGIFFTVTYLYVRYYGKHLNDADKWTAIWFGFDGLCHLLFEGVYLLFSFIGPIKNVDALIVLPCTLAIESVFSRSELVLTLLFLVAGGVQGRSTPSLISDGKYTMPM